MNKFYTRAGDQGYTGLLGEGRVPKYHPIPEAVGAIDEASAALGLARAASQSERTPAIILKVQRDLYAIMSEVAATPENATRFRQIDADRVSWLESKVDSIGEMVELPKDFIMPGDSAAGAACALARTVVRRSERRVARLLHDETVQNVELLRYLNRLSSLCFVLELLENVAAGHSSPTLAIEK